MRRGLVIATLALVLSGAIGLGIGTSGVAAASAPIYATSACVSGQAATRIDWGAIEANAKEVWVDLSYYDNGFKPDTFRTTGPIPTGQNSLGWNSLTPETTYFVRVNQLLSNGQWDATRTYFFKTASCGPVVATTVPVASMPQKTYLYGSAEADAQAALGIPPAGFCKIHTCWADESPVASFYIVPSAEYCAVYATLCYANRVWNGNYCALQNCITYYPPPRPNPNPLDPTINSTVVNQH